MRNPNRGSLLNSSIDDKRRIKYRGPGKPIRNRNAIQVQHRNMECGILSSMSMTLKCGPSPSLFISRAITVGKNFASVHSFKGALQSTDNPMLGSGNFNNNGINIMPRFANSNLLPNLKVR